MMPSAPPDPRHTQLRTWYDQITARIAAADKDIGRSVYEHERQLHRERLAELTVDRGLVATYLDALERDQPIPGPWPPELKTADLLAAPQPRILFKSGRCDFYRHIPLPPNYIPRPELLAEVRERLLAGTGGLALTSAIQVRRADVLHGMGGIGKSVLARALCDALDVQAAFPDGILWATLGQTPDLTARLREWIETLGGVVGQTAPTLDQLRNTLAEALRDKACLLIVDDAWRKAHLEPFCAGGPRCRLLITTRDAALAEGLEAGVYPVPVMAPDEAIALLEEWAQVSMAEIEAEVKAKIVKRLGYLPLAVRLAGAQLRAKDPVEWLASFDARKLKTRRVETVHDSLETTFGLSLDVLAPADRRLYVALAIFKEDEATPVVAIAKLWSAIAGREADETSELLDDLTTRTLVARSQEGSGAVIIHDLLRDFMAAELGEEGRIAAHRALLDAYHKTERGDGWHTAPDDSYLYNHLAYHLDQLADHDTAADSELHKLFAGQAWLHARVPQSGYLYDGYLADLSLAWRRAHAAAGCQIDADQEPPALVDCICYALIRTNVNSLAASYEPSMVARAVESGLWSVERAFGVADRIPDPRVRMAMYAALLKVPQLPPAFKTMAQENGIAAAQALGDERARAWAVYMELPDQAQERARVRAKLAEQLPEKERARLLEYALKEALQTQRGITRAEALAVLAPLFPSEMQERVLELTLAAALTEKDEWNRAEGVVVLAPFLTERLLAHGLAEVAMIRDKELQGETLTRISSHLTGDAVAYGLMTALAIEDEWWRAEMLAELAPRLAGRELGHAMTAALRMKDPNNRAWSLVSLAPRLTDDAKVQALEAALAAALSIEDTEHKAEALAALAPHLMGHEKAQALEAALTAALSIMKEDRAGILETLSPQLSGKALEAGLIPALHIEGEEWVARALVALVPSLTGIDRSRVLEAGLRSIATIPDEMSRAWLLEELTPQLEGEFLERALEIALAIHEVQYRAQALAALAKRMTGPARTHVLQLGLTSALSTHEQYERVQALLHLAPYLTKRLAQRVLETIEVTEGGLAQIEVLAALIPRLSARSRVKALQIALASARSMPENRMLARALALLAPELTGETRLGALQCGLEAALAIEDDWDQARVLTELAPQLTEDLLQRALTSALALENPGAQARALGALVPHLTGSPQERGLEAVLAIRDEAARAETLERVVQGLNGESLARGLKAALAIQDEEQRADVLTALAPALSWDLLNKAVTGATTIKDHWSRARALAELLPRMSIPAGIVRLIRHDMLDTLRQDLAAEEREDLLQFCQNNVLFTPPIFSPTTLAAIARHIIEICQEWEWL